MCFGPKQIFKLNWRFPNAVAAITPYAAVQAQNFHTPTYSEIDITGGGSGPPWPTTIAIQNFVRMTLRKRSFVCSIPPRLQVLRPPIQPNHRLLIRGRALIPPAGTISLSAGARYEDRPATA